MVQKSFASAMLCLLLLLSVAAVRCEMRCSLVPMPMAMQTAAASEDAVAMDAGMTHCDGMQSVSKSMPVVNAACGAAMCQHQAIASAADSQFDSERYTALPPVVLRVDGAAVQPTQTPHVAAERPPLLQVTPFDQTVSLRV